MIPPPYTLHTSAIYKQPSDEAVRHGQLTVVAGVKFIQRESIHFDELVMVVKYSNNEV